MADRSHLDAGDFAAERRRLVEICLGIDERAGLISQAAYWPNRTGAADRAAARAAEEQNQIDRTEIERRVVRALDHHAAAMLAWAESAIDLARSDAYVRGWQQVLDAWRSGDAAPASPDYSFAWLVAMWHRAS